MAAADYTSLVQSLYVAYFGRPADTFGLQNFANSLNAVNAPTTAVELTAAYRTDASLRTLVDSFANSKESSNLYGSGDTLNFVTSIYQNVLNRPPAFEGLVFWTKAIEEGRLTKANAALSIMAAASTNTTTQGLLDGKTVANKVAVASQFTTSIDTGPELSAYSGAAAAAQARALLQEVDSTTVPTAFQTRVDAVLANIVVGGATVVVTNLGVGLDAFVGSAANDTINAVSVNPVTGAAASTLGSFDTINGGAGTDTLNIFATATENNSQAATVTGVEIVNVYNTGTGAGLLGGATGLDASKYVGATQVWQQGVDANKVINLGATTAAGFNGTAGEDLVVTAAAATANIATAGVSGSVGNVVTVNVDGAALASVNLSGSIAKTTANGADASAALNVDVGTDVTSLAVNTALKTTLVVTQVGSTKDVVAVDASASTGAITYVAGTTKINNVKTGAGADTVTVSTATLAAAVGVTAINASVATAAGNDTINVSTTGTGTTTIDGGAGDDTLVITTRSDGILTVMLGEGTDNLTSAVAINATDVINAGGGIDTLALSLVGSANIGAFAGFDIFDVAALGAKTLDVDILASKNTVTEFVASATTAGASVLTNVGAGVGFRAVGDMGAGVVTLTQKTAGAITVTVDADEKTDADDAIDTATASVTLTNATSAKAVFDTAYLATTATETTVGDNVSTLNLIGGELKTIEVTSGGAFSNNVLALGAVAKAESITITGASALSITGATQAKLVNIDGSAATGGLTVDTTTLFNGGTIKLGSGADMITIGATSVAPTGALNVGVESIVGFEKTAAGAISTDAVVAAAAVVGADVLTFAGALTVANASAITGGAVGAKGVLTFTGAGPSDLAAAVGIAALAAETEGEAVLFQYLGDSYVYGNGTADVLVKLVGIAGVTDLIEVGATNTFTIV